MAEGDRTSLVPDGVRPIHAYLKPAFAGHELLKAQLKIGMLLFGHCPGFRRGSVPASRIVDRPRRCWKAVDWPSRPKPDRSAWSRPPSRYKESDFGPPRTREDAFPRQGMDVLGHDDLSRVTFSVDDCILHPYPKSTSAILSADIEVVKQVLIRPIDPLERQENLAERLNRDWALLGPQPCLIPNGWVEL